MTVAQMLFGFDGRIRRGQYWLWSTGVAVAVAVIGGVELSATGAVDGLAGPGQFPAGGGLAKPGWLLFYALTAGAYWIFLALEVKRWHDRGKSWVWALIALVPFGALWALIECGVLDGTRGPNRFGPSPKDVAGLRLTRPAGDKFADRTLSSPFGGSTGEAGDGGSGPSGR